MASHQPTVLVTGASRGIGLAVARLLSTELGANVVALSRSSTPDLDAIKSPSLLHILCDLTDEQAFNSAVSTAIATYGRIDSLVLNASTVEPLCRIGDDTPLSAWKEAFDLNFFSLVTAIKATLLHLRKSPSPIRGKIIFISSGAATGGYPGMGPYSPSKAAMNALCRTMAEEEPEIVSVALVPGMVDTGMQEAVRQNGGGVMSTALYELFIRAHAEGELVKPEDCGYVIATLALRAAPELNGVFTSWDSEECLPYRSQRPDLSN